MGWHCKNTGYYWSNNPVTYYPDADGLENCDQIYYILKGKGWTTNAICGLLTCISLESGFNPWKWEGSNPGGYALFSNQTDANNDQLNATSPDYYGYGLVQWTPASYSNVRYYNDNGVHPNKYQTNPYATSIPGYGPNFNAQPGSIYDGYAQIVYLDNYGYVGQYSHPGGYYSDIAPTFSAFKSSTAAASDLCETWVVNFERPTNPADRRSQRQALATELYNHYNGKPVLPPDTPGLPVWLLFKFRENNFGRK